MRAPRSKIFNENWVITTICDNAFKVLHSDIEDQWFLNIYFESYFRFYHGCDFRSCLVYCFRCDFRSCLVHCFRCDFRSSLGRCFICFCVVRCFRCYFSRCFSCFVYRCLSFFCILLAEPINNLIRSSRNVPRTFAGWEGGCVAHRCH